MATPRWWVRWWARASCALTPDIRGCVLSRDRWSPWSWRWLGPDRQVRSMIPSIQPPPDKFRRDKLYKWYMSLKQSDGSFIVSTHGEVDVRYGCTLSMNGSLSSLFLM